MQTESGNAASQSATVTRKKKKETLNLNTTEININTIDLRKARLNILALETHGQQSIINIFQDNDDTLSFQKICNEFEKFVDPYTKKIDSDEKFTNESRVTEQLEISIKLKFIIQQKNNYTIDRAELNRLIVAIEVLAG